ncbi:MAG: hypothetical protein JO201_02570 [Verrucomicrobia bacterium]|nr:hypothetical protein [Verrucomicrobiota bacterium]
MKRACVWLLFVALTASFAAEAQNFTGEYADRSFLGGQATFQMSLEQGGNAVSVWFSAGYNDGHSIQPVADGSGKVSGKGTVEFTFKDSSNNVGTGTITRAGDDVIVSIKPTRVADSRCLELYRQNMRLKRVSKK